MSHFSPTSARSRKPPRPLWSDVYAFAPNRDILGGIAYFIVGKDGQNILVDCPPWDEISRQFCRDRGGVQWLFISQRQGISKVLPQIHDELGCTLVIQEQEAYLLPQREKVTFAQELRLNEETIALWTPGFSPGSSCLHLDRHGGILFSGRHLLPDQGGKLQPLRTTKTFHWPRQLRSIQTLRDRFHGENLNYTCPAANVGFFRGQGYGDRTYTQLQNLDLTTLAQQQPLL